MPEKQQPFVGQSQFADVDQAAEPTSFVAHLDQITAMAPVLAYKRETFALLRIQAGDHLLDVGCGAGDDVRALASFVGNGGLVVGLDSSATMIRTAQMRAENAQRPLVFTIGNVTQLDFPDASFDGVRADRVLHHLTSYEQAFAEMVRVTRTGGRIVIFDPDFDGTIINAPDLGMTRQVIHAYTDRFPQGQCGRHLYRLCKEAGLTEIALIPKTFMFTQFEQAEQLLGLSDVVQSIAVHNPAEAESAAAWLQELQAASREEKFFFMLLGMIAVGQKV